MVSLQRAIYSVLLYLLMPVEFLMLYKRSRKAPPYLKRWSERFGFKTPNVSGEVIWFHTVSVGETLAAVPVIKAVHQTNPDACILVTTMTPTGSEQVINKLGDIVTHCYTPYDLPHSMNKFVSAIKPSCLFIMETELWPNMLHYAHKMNTRIVLMNARMSEKSARGYARFPTMTQTMLNQIDTVAVHNSTDAERFKQLGAPESKIEVTGNIKFDLNIPLEVSQEAASLRKDIKAQPIWLAASTHQGEDEILIDAHKRLLADYPSAMLILVPRHPERFDEVFKLCKQSSVTSYRRSEEPIPMGQIYLADTMGEVLVFCALADAVFIGGSLVNHGGHNCLEPAAFKKPVMSGPHDFNFAEINRQLISANGLAVVQSANDIQQQLGIWFENHASAQQVGEAGHQVVLENRGAVDRLLKILNR